MAPQPSFDPLAQPDMLAALTRPGQQQAPPGGSSPAGGSAPLGGWTSFDNDAFSDRTRSVCGVPVICRPVDEAPSANDNVP